MAKAAKKKSKAVKKSARMTAKPKAAAKSAKTAKKPARKKVTAPKIDPLNRKVYPAMSPNLTVSDIRRAIDFYTNAFGFKVKSVIDTPMGIMHAELTFRETVLMLSPEHPQQGGLSARSIGNTPMTLYILVEDVDSVFSKALAVGGTAMMPVQDMFWGDRAGVVGDLDGNKWMVATHKSNPSEAEMANAMRQMSQSAGAAGD